jgi:hypothetical protein
MARKVLLVAVLLAMAFGCFAVYLLRNRPEPWSPAFLAQAKLNDKPIPVTWNPFGGGQGAVSREYLLPVESEPAITLAQKELRAVDGWTAVFTGGPSSSGTTVYRHQMDAQWVKGDDALVIYRSPGPGGTTRVRVWRREGRLRATLRDLLP